MEKEELLLIHGTEYKEMTREILYAAGLEAQIGARDKFDDNNVCFVKVTDGKETFYLTVKYKNGYTFSNDKYIEP